MRRPLTEAEEVPGEKGGAGFELLREDDNGARFLIGQYDTKAAAEQRAEELARGGHKQHYFVQPAEQRGELECRL